MSGGGCAVQVYKPYLLMNKKRYAGLLWTNPEKFDKMDTKVLQLIPSGYQKRSAHSRQCRNSNSVGTLGVAGTAGVPVAWCGDLVCVGARSCLPSHA